MGKHWLAYECPECQYRTFSAPGGLPCVRCLRGQPAVVDVVRAADCEGAVEALRKYGRHKRNCARRITGEPSSSCDCGFADALERHGGQ